MKFSNLRHDSGVAGTTVLISLIVSLFIIGLLVMIFALMGGSLQDSSYTTTGVTVTGESGAWLNSSGYTVDQASQRDFSAFAVTSIVNATDSVVITAGNYTVGSTGVLTNASARTWTDVNVTYTYSYSANNTATDVIGDTTQSIATVTQFFSLFIVIGAMVVLVLLTVIIIVAIRQSGIMGESTA